MAVKAKYHTVKTLEQQYEAILNRNLKGMSVDGFQTSRTIYKKTKIPADYGKK